jgi:tetratricopeptide (TPR) repeat protein
METALTRPAIGTFVLVTGDSDFSAVARKLRSYGKYVVGIGLRDATSEVLVRSCDEFILYDKLVEIDEVINNQNLEHARKLLVAAMRLLTAEYPGDVIPAAEIKQQLLRLAPDFDEKILGHSKFSSFLRSQRDLVTISELETGPAASLIPALKRGQLDHALSYQTALNTAGFRLVKAQVRQEILHDLYQLLSEQPLTFTLDEAVLQLKAQYDEGNILRSRDDIYETAKLVKQANVIDPEPESWELDTLSIRSGLTPQSFVDRCESVYVAVLLGKHLPIDDDSLSSLLFGTVDHRDRIRMLVAIAEQAEGHAVAQEPVTANWPWPVRLTRIPELQFVLEDISSWQLHEEPSLEKSQEYNNQGLQIRTTDFESARLNFLQAAKMLSELVKRREPGASQMDLEWYVASYCATAAGAHFSRREYAEAYRHYLAFFALVKESEPVWDRVRRLVPPMLSFFFTIAPNESHALLKVSPGRTHPARLAVLLYNHEQKAVRERWTEMARELARVNPALVRGLIQRIQFLEDDETVPGAHETRLALARMLDSSTSLKRTPGQLADDTTKTNQDEEFSSSYDGGSGYPAHAGNGRSTSSPVRRR